MDAAEERKRVCAEICQIFQRTRDELDRVLPPADSSYWHGHALHHLEEARDIMIGHLGAAAQSADYAATGAPDPHG